MPSRRSHTKSHHGCAQCKARRVKCDENLPSCERCVRRQMNCSFVEQVPPASASSFATPIPEDTHFQFRDENTKASEPSPNILTPISISSLPEYNTGSVFSTSATTFSLAELDLVHHYSTKTYITITSRLTSHVIWRDVIFREALRHPFLLNGIMATSALHKAHCEPEASGVQTELYRRALAYQNAALAGYIPALSNPNKENCIALFAISAWLSVWAFGSGCLPKGFSNSKTGPAPSLSMRHRSDTSSEEVIDFESVISVLQILQGINAVVMQTKHWLWEELSEFLLNPRDEELPAIGPDVETSFNMLAERISLSYEEHQDVSDSAKEIQEIYIERLQSLRTTARCRTVLEWDPYVFSWPVTVKPLYMDLLRQHDPIAVALFIHWAACFRALDHIWWARGWAYRLVKDVSTLLDDSWSEILRWPRQAVGIEYQIPADRIKNEDGA